MLDEVSGLMGWSHSRFSSLNPQILLSRQLARAGIPYLAVNNHVLLS